jgi:hypothetical protein
MPKIMFLHIYEVYQQRSLLEEVSDLPHCPNSPHLLIWQWQPRARRLRITGAYAVQSVLSFCGNNWAFLGRLLATRLPRHQLAMPHDPSTLDK